ncbi:Co2+/Mg2+ efflux protein ApaG [Polycladidibacter hongkongensis]|uniref:Co2+/Mg2+ efflux protein ApaG n=1 Tax=Polycladidibacter hongkongensis TaxID=1647556 RepID=UPI00082C549F|nr:Co2+/Mg2+ efflux protein ApaG [Pseudovibrio hongkongensis]
MYRSITRDVQITVEPKFLADESEPAEQQYFWSYTIAIANLSTEAIKLRRRAWTIIDARGHKREVSGVGVVGEEPVIEPGDTFEYTSGCPLSTSSGIMSGSYTMQSETGETFSVEVPTFSLDTPESQRVLN